MRTLVPQCDRGVARSEVHGMNVAWHPVVLGESDVCKATDGATSRGKERAQVG